MFGGLVALAAQHFLALSLKEALHYTFLEAVSPRWQFHFWKLCTYRVAGAVFCAACELLAAAGEVPLEVFLRGKCNIW